MKQKIPLDEFEQDIEDNFQHLEPILDMETQMAALRKAASLHSTKRKSITLRIHAMDLEAMKINASKVGIPYQTYINMLIHKDATSEHKW